MRLITFDRQEHTEHYLDSGLIDATICQNPYIQGYRPVKILYTSPDIRIKQNL